MEKNNVKLHDFLTNKLNGKSGIVVEIQPWKIVLRYEIGGEAEILPQYFEPADAEIIKRLEPLLLEIKSTPTRNSGDGQKSGNRDHKAELTAHFQKQIALYPAAETVLPTFWAELLSLVGDQPEKTWAMRSPTSEHYCPVINAKNLETGNWVQCLYILTGSTIRLELKKEFLPGESAGLFPLLNTMYNSCNAVEFEYSAFNSETRAKYLDCLRMIYARH